MVTCLIADCERPVAHRGWCNGHYIKWQRYGDPLVSKRPRYGTKRRVRPDGYVDLWDPAHALARSDGYVFEHRKVAWEAGILTDPSDEVHHVNHDRTDNRPENLEAKSGGAHARDHAESAGQVTNQYGTFPVKPRGSRSSDIYPSQRRRSTVYG